MVHYIAWLCRTIIFLKATNLLFQFNSLSEIEWFEMCMLDALEMSITYHVDYFYVMINFIPIQIKDLSYNRSVPSIQVIFSHFCFTIFKHHGAFLLTFRLKSFQNRLLLVSHSRNFSVRYTWSTDQPSQIPSPHSWSDHLLHKGLPFYQ